MNKLSFFIVLLLCLCSAMVIYSCKKVDKTKSYDNVTFPENWSDRFFQLPKNPHPALQRVADIIKKQKNGTAFLENFVRANGFIIWDKAEIVVKHKKRNIYASETGGNNDTLILLPTVPWMEEIVKSVVAVKLNGEVSFKTYIDKFYASNGFDLDPDREKPNADDVVKKIMEFEKGIFGTEQYKITDKRLFRYISSASATCENFVYKLVAMSIPDDEGQCMIFTAWITTDGGLTWTEGESWESPSCSPDNPLIGGGGSGGSVDWGGDSDPVFGDGGGSTNPDSTGNSVVDCIPWVRLREANGSYDYNTPAPCVVPPVQIDSIPNPCDQVDSLAKDIALTRFMDTLKTKATDSTNRAEDVYLYVNNISTNAIDYALLQGDTGVAGIAIEINAKTDGYLHNHYTGLLSVFSPDDLWTLCKLYKDSQMVNALTYTAFVTTAAGTHYILKIEDLNKFKTFADDLTTGDFGLYYAAYERWWGIKKDNPVDLNERYFLKYLTKTNGGSGLKLFRGNDTFTEWTPLGLDRDGNVAEVPCE